MYTVWIQESSVVNIIWRPHECNSLPDVLLAIKEADYHDYRVTREVLVELVEVPNDPR